MSARPPLTRPVAVAELRRFGIRGPLVYLIDLIPLIEMIWADGKAQECEIDFLDDYLRRHVAHVNELAGHTILVFDDARAFLERYLEERPDPELLRTLRSFVAPIRLSSSDAGQNEAIKASLLASCLDIAASSVTEYPFSPGERFNADEKRAFFEILASLEG